jgi:SAM-dependent methyltransferase
VSDKIKKHYLQLYKKYGDSSQSLQFSDRASHFKRFEILLSISAEINSLIDLGCGLAHLFEYMIHKGYKGKYLGLDFLPEFIASNIGKYKDYQQAKFHVFDIKNDDLPNSYDFIVLNGVFNNKMDDNELFMLHSIEKMFKACEKGVAFNAMSTYVEYFDENLYYSNPVEIFDFCKKNLTKKIVLRHDYVVKEYGFPFEYTMYLYK